MDRYFTIIFTIFAVIAFWEGARYFFHLRKRRKIGTVISVNGTRGKSSVARLLCFALREGGLRVAAKTTGTIPQFLSADGTISEIARGTYPNINEQLMVVQRAALEKADVLVAECMAVEPNYQKVTEEKMLRSDIGIITNVRTDHREVMGSNREQIAEAMCSTIPARKIVFTAERDNFYIIDKNAARKRAKAVQCRPADSVTDEMMRPFHFLEQRENVALALDVCRYMGVSGKTALEGMYKTVPDPGVLSSVRIERHGKQFKFVNAFSANDPDSLALLWKEMSKKFLPGQKNFFIFNSRRDRPYRSVDTARIFSAFPVDIFIIIGEGGALFRRFLIKSGVRKDRVRHIGKASTWKVLKACFSEAGDRNFVFCAGNIKGKGLELFDRLRSLSAPGIKKGEA